MTPPDRWAFVPFERKPALSQPPYQPVPGPPFGGAAPAQTPAPAAPTQVVFPGQVQLAPQPQYAPSPQQAQQQQGGAFATGFPNYVPPPPSPPNRTSLLVGTLVVVLTVIFAVVGFWLVS
jgi:hypothetical protein